MHWGYHLDLTDVDGFAILGLGAIWPGAASTEYAGFVNNPMRARREIVLIDQRGTGRSNPSLRST